MLSTVSPVCWHLKPQQCKQHPDEHFSLLCLEQQCLKRGPICAQCQLFNHPKHLSKPIALALREIADDLEPQSSTLHFIVKLDHIKITFHAIVARLGRLRAELQPELNRFFRNINDKISNYRVLCAKILAQKHINSEFVTLINQYKFYQREEEDKNKINFELFLANLVKQINERCIQFEQCISKKEDTTALLKLLTPIDSQKRYNYIFGSNHHTSISLTPDSLTAKQSNNYSTNFAFIQPLVQGKRILRSRKSVKIYINKLTSWLSVGAAYLSFAQKSSYYFNTGSIGHGGYMLSYNGYTWHHSDTTLNSAYGTFNFAQGDTVTITINPSSTKILFEREGCAPYELPYDRLPGEEFYFCVSLSSHEESVSIIK